MIKAGPPLELVFGWEVSEEGQIAMQRYVGTTKEKEHALGSIGAIVALSINSNCTSTYLR